MYSVVCREALDSWLTTCQGGAAGPGPPGLMVLTTGLSRPFRQLERLAGAIQVGLRKHIKQNARIPAWSLMVYILRTENKHSHGDRKRRLKYF